MQVSTDEAKREREQLLRDRRKSLSALRFYVPATILMVFIFSQVPSVGAGVLLGLAAMALVGDLYVYVHCTIIRLRRAPDHKGG